MNYKHNNEIMYIILETIIAMILCVIGFAILLDNRGEAIISITFGFTFFFTGLILLLLIMNNITKEDKQ